MIPQRLDPAGDACELAFKWRVDVELAQRLILFARLFPHPVQIVSGFRTRSQQAAEKDGAPIDVSTHTSCPATGADLQVIGWSKPTAPTEVRRAFGGAVQAAGLRWGGGSRVDPQTGLPTDWNHVDLGPRAR